MIEIVKVWKRRGHNEVLKGVSFCAHRGEVVCLLGPSGAGKSTLLRCINALEENDSGVVYVDGISIGCRERLGRLHQISERELCRQRADIGMVFQNFNLFPHMTVLENIVDAPLRVKKEAPDVVLKRAEELLARVGLADRGKQLSAPSFRRTAAARRDCPGAGDGAESDALRRGRPRRSIPSSWVRSSTHEVARRGAG